nr:protein S-acyltransferase 18-like [Tanacetum cinerariifolium]
MLILGVDQVQKELGTLFISPTQVRYYSYPPIPIYVEKEPTNSFGGIEKVTDSAEQSTAKTTSGGIRKVTNEEEKSTVETTSGGIEKVAYDEEKSAVKTTWGGIEKVTDIEEKSTVETTALPVLLKEQEDGNTNRGTLIETDEKSPEKRQDARLGESRLRDGSGSIEKDVNVGGQSTKELSAAKEETEVFGTIDCAMLVETEAKPLKEDSDGVHGETVTETEENTDALPSEQPSMQDARLGESRLRDGSGSIEKDVNVGGQSTKELSAAKHPSPPRNKVVFMPVYSMEAYKMSRQKAQLAAESGPSNIGVMPLVVKGMVPSLRRQLYVSPSKKQKYKSNFVLELTEVSKELDTYIFRQVLCSLIKKGDNESCPSPR